MNDTSYTWSSSFVLPYESEWSIREKFSYLNALPPVGDKKTKRIISVPEDYSSYDKIRWYPFWERGLRACPKCIQSGYHSIIHDLGYFEYCFIHKDTRLEFYSYEAARSFEKGEPQLYRFLPQIRTIDLLNNQELRMQIESYKSMIKHIFPEHLCILDYHMYKEYDRQGYLYENTRFSLIEHCFMPNNPWIKGKDRVLLQIDTSEISYANRKCLWNAAKYSRKIDAESIPSQIFVDAKKTRYRQLYSCDFKLDIILKNYFHEKTIELFSSENDYDIWEHTINVSTLKLNDKINLLKLSIYIIYRSICSANSPYYTLIGPWKKVEYSMMNNFMPVNFFNINYLEDELDKSPDKYYYIHFKEIILRDALDYAIEELSNILEQKLICLDKGFFNSYFPIKFPQYIIKKTGEQWSIVACDPPEGLPDEYSIYEKIHREYNEKMRTAVNRCTLKK